MRQTTRTLRVLGAAALSLAGALCWPDAAQAQTPVQFAAAGKTTTWQSVAARARPYPLTDQFVHRAELTGLTPGTEYQFRLGDSAATTWSGGSSRAASGIGRSKICRHRPPA